MLYCEAILQRAGGARVATVAEFQKIVRFRTEKTHAGDNEGDGMRFDYALTCIFLFLFLFLFSTNLKTVPSGGLSGEAKTAEKTHIL